MQPQDLAFVAENHHAAAAHRPPDFGTRPAPGTMRGYFENREGEQWMAMATAKVFQLSSGDVGWEVLKVELSGERTLAMLRDGLSSWTSLARNPENWPKLWVLDRAELTWLLAFLDAASERFDHRLRPK